MAWVWQGKSHRQGRLRVVSEELGLYGTPEAKVLFDRWVSEMEQAVLEFIQESGTIEPQKIAEHLNISSDSAQFFLNRLAGADSVGTTLP